MHKGINTTLDEGQTLIPTIGAGFDVAHSLRADGFDASEDGSHANAGGHAAIAIQERAVSENLENGPGGSGISTEGAAYTLEAHTVPQAVQYGWRVRRLTPTECERLQGFPDGYTDIPWRGKPGAPDGPRYKALGNSMACNVMRWIGRRIEMVEAA